jgi:hypothetical protein
VSNERNAEAHGTRVTVPTQVAVLDGFCQIGRAKFWEGGHGDPRVFQVPAFPSPDHNLFALLADAGLVHHAYDAALGCFAACRKWEVWMLPVACWHQGGQTAVGDPGYNEWARTIVPGGDQDFWEIAHKEVYDAFKHKGVLPIRIR